MIINHSIDDVLNAAVFSKISHLKQSKRWKTGLSLLKSCANKLVLFICLESILVASVFFGTGYVVVLT